MAASIHHSLSKKKQKKNHSKWRLFDKQNLYNTLFFFFNMSMNPFDEHKTNLQNYGINLLLG